MNVFLGIDCGATHLRIGVFDEEKNLLSSVKVNSPLKHNPNDFAKIVKEQFTLMSEGKNGWQIKAIGVGVPGPVDREKGLILPSANIGNQEPIDLKNQLEKEFNVPVIFDRDTNVALIGEVEKGEAGEAKNVVMLTLGSGVGGAIMIDGKIDHGASGKAGEIGHVILSIPPSATFRCGLGHNGCFEALINSSKNPEEMATVLGYGLANIVDIFNPEKIILGGGKVEYLPKDQKAEFLAKAVEVMQVQGMKGAVDEVQVSYATLGDNSGIYGAGKMAQTNL